MTRIMANSRVSSAELELFKQEFLLYGGACDADSGGAGRGQNLQRDRNPSRKCHLPAPPLRAAVPLLKRRDGARASG
jgi:hypothetical protein